MRLHLIDHFKDVIISASRAAGEPMPQLFLPQDLKETYMNVKKSLADLLDFFSHSEMLVNSY